MRKNTIRTFVLITALFLNTGCATIMSGESQDLQVFSEPSGAIVTVNGEKKLTPNVFFLNRRRGPYKVTFEKPGYRSVTIELKRGTNSWAWGNIVTGGLGLIVDILTGSIRKHTPDEIRVDFIKGKIGFKAPDGKPVYC